MEDFISLQKSMEQQEGSIYGTIKVTKINKKLILHKSSGKWTNPEHFFKVSR